MKSTTNMKNKIKFIVLCSLFMPMFIGGVFANWVFAEGPIENAQGNQNLNIDDWYYAENVPGGGENADDDFNHGISHAGLIQDIVDDIKLYFSEDNSIIMDVIEGIIEDEKNNGDERDHNGVGSSTKTNNGAALRDFAGSNGYNNLGFFIYYGPDITSAEDITKLEIYTYALSDTEGRQGEYIEVYKTIAEYSNGDWVLRGGWKGTAPIILYGNSNTQGKYKNVIDPLKWTQVN